MSLHAKPNFKEIVKSHSKFENNYHSALAYAQTELSASQLKEEALKYYKNDKLSDDEFNKLNEIDERDIFVIGKYAYILNNGGELPDHVFDKLDNNLRQILEEKTPKNKEKASKVKENKQPVDRNREVIAEINGWVDGLFQNENVSVLKSGTFVQLFQDYNIKPSDMPFIYSTLDKQFRDFEILLNGTDKELAEGYRNLSKNDLKRAMQFEDELKNACTQYSSSPTKVAKVKVKVRTKEEIVSKLKYLKNDPLLGLTSENPTSILGAKTVWVFNTKTKKLSYYTSKTGLSVEKSTITNFTENSKEKLVRNPSLILQGFKTKKESELKSLFDTIKSVDVEPTGKITETHILLKIQK